MRRTGHGTEVGARQRRGAVPQPRRCQRRRAAIRRAVVIAVLATATSARGGEPFTPPRDDGYRGIWYANQALDPATAGGQRYKYSGGFATYPQQHAPIAVHAPAVGRTFFVYGGSDPAAAGGELVHMVSCYDHATGTVPRPVRLLVKGTGDAHDNPVLSIDAAGHLLVVSPAHGTARPAAIHRSTRPYDITEWEAVDGANRSYPQVWWLPGAARFLLLHTRYVAGERTLCIASSADGRDWTAPVLFAHAEKGHYQVSARHPGSDRVGTAFDLHPDHGRPGTGLDWRTNLSYAESADGGVTWTTAGGQPVPLPITAADSPALVRDYRTAGKSVYLKDLAFTPAGRPVILFLTAGGFQPGPTGGPREWWTAAWDGAAWDIRALATSDHAYDHGSLWCGADGTWLVVAPTDPGPQPGGAGGEMVLWTSHDVGRSWARRPLTAASARNHGYARTPAGADPGFHALWADGSPLEKSPSRLHFCSRDGRVFRLPERMEGERAAPEEITLPGEHSPADNRARR